MKSYKVIDLAKAISNKNKIKIIGVRPVKKYMKILLVIKMHDRLIE